MWGALERTPMYMCLKNNIAMVLESTPGYMCMEKAIAEILVGREPSMCIARTIWMYISATIAPSAERSVHQIRTPVDMCLKKTIADRA